LIKPWGDLFVVRIAGNSIAPFQIGSIEYAVEHLGTRLVIILCHSNCGAVTAALEAMISGSPISSNYLKIVIDAIRPAVEPILHNHRSELSPLLLSRSVEANVKCSVDRLCSQSEVVEKCIQEDGLIVMGAEYALETGIVDFYE
jgi:carbonic anhydrase